MNPKDLVENLLSEDQIPPVEKLFRIFSKVNADCSKTGESVVDFTDTDYYADQIDAMWGGNDSETVNAAAVALRDYAKAKGYKLAES